MMIAGWVVVFLMTVTLHELCHGLAAYYLGDDTAKRAGRLTLNPLRHIDPFWTVILPLVLYISTQGRFMIGMAKPVPVNFSRLRHPKTDMIWVALAGPLANFVLAALFSFLLHTTGNSLFLYVIYFNLGLAMFNLVPIPPLDGSRIVAGFLPSALAYPFLRLERYGFVLVILLYMTGFLYYFVIPGINFFSRLLQVPGLGDF